MRTPRKVFCLLVCLLLTSCVHRSRQPYDAATYSCWAEEDWQAYYEGVPVNFFPKDWRLEIRPSQPFYFLEGRTVFFPGFRETRSFACQLLENKKTFAVGETSSLTVPLFGGRVLAWEKGSDRSRWSVRIGMKSHIDSKKESFELYCRAEKESLASNFHIADVLQALNQRQKTSKRSGVCLPPEVEKVMKFQ